MCLCYYQALYNFGPEKPAAAKTQSQLAVSDNLEQVAAGNHEIDLLHTHCSVAALQTVEGCPVCCCVLAVELAETNLVVEQNSEERSDHISAELVVLACCALEQPLLGL